MGFLNIRNISLFLICSIPFCSEYIALKNTYIKMNYKTFKWEEYLEKYADKKEPLYTMNSHGGFYSYYGYKTYIDTRAELFIKKNNHKEDIFHEFYLIMNGKILYDEFLNKYQFHYLVVDKREPFYKYLKSDYNTYYHPVYGCKKLIVYERNSE